VELPELLETHPSLHRDGDRQVSFALPDEVLRFIDSAVDAGSRTLETGAGLSTVLFALERTEHTCVVPFATEVEDITRWCADAGISTERVRFEIGSSERLLPMLDPSQLDLVLIDGAHAFPIPFMDWYYAGRRLRLGGKLVVDDTNLWTGSVLREFLRDQPGWDLLWEHEGRSVVFERTGDEDPPYWLDQPYVVRRSRPEGETTLRRGMSMLRRGELGTFGRKAFENLRRRVKPQRGDHADRSESTRR
jgi:hypothetical protein